MIPYILYASLILTACFIFYKLLLQKETFFNLNRFVLLACMLLAFVLPVLRVPQQMSLRKMTATVNNASQETLVYPANTAPQVKPDIHPTSIEPVKQNKVVNPEKVMQWLVYLYWFGVAVFSFNFLMQVVILLYKSYSGLVIKDGKFRIVEMSGDKAPCSFGNNIFINPAKYDWVTYNQVLLHEKIHIKQKHTLDLLLAEVVLIFQWFNPFAWLWRKELESNLEFFTDDILLQHNSVEKESYQVSLLKVAAPHFPLSLTTNYNQSLLKKRLLMMNAKKSNVHTIWKYFFLLPLMVLFVCLFNEPAVKSQNIDLKENTKKQGNPGIATEGAWFATIKQDKINIQFKNNDDENSSNNSTFQLNEFKDLPKDKPGTFTLVREAGTMEFKGKFDGDTGMGRYKFIPNKAYTDDMLKDGVDVTGDRDAMVFFIINVKRSYVKMLKQNGYTDIDKDKLIPLAALNVDEAYIASIKQAGIGDIELDNLVTFKALNINKAYIDEIRQAGYKNVTPDKIITFKAQGIDGKYIADFRSSATKEVKDKNIQGKDPDKDNDKKPDITNKNVHPKNPGSHHKAKDDDDMDDDDLIAFKAMNIDNAFINSFREVGYNNLSNSDLISLKALGVSPEYVISFRNAGYANLKADELVSLKSQNITPSLIKQYKDLGFDNLNLDDVIGAKATGTSPDFIKSMKEKGHNLKSLDKYIALRTVLGN